MELAGAKPEGAGLPAAQLARAAAAEPVRRFRGCAEVVDLIKLADPQPCSAAVRVVRLPGRCCAFAEKVGPANSSPAGVTDEPEHFYFAESDLACSAPASSSDADANAGPAVGADCKGPRSASPTTPYMPQVAHSGE